MSGARDLVFFFNGVELTDESVENVPAEFPVPVEGSTMRRGGKVWAAMGPAKSEHRFRSSRCVPSNIA